MPRKIFPLRLSDEERALIEEGALANGLKLSEYVRGKILADGKIISKKKSHLPIINQQVYIELSRLAQSLQELVANRGNSQVEENPVLSFELTLLKEIHQYLKELRLQVIGEN